jgi:hypothetical protein
VACGTRAMSTFIANRTGSTIVRQIADGLKHADADPLRWAKKILYDKAFIDAVVRAKVSFPRYDGFSVHDG